MQNHNNNNHHNNNKTFHLYEKASKLRFQRNEIIFALILNEIYIYCGIYLHFHHSRSKPSLKKKIIFRMQRIKKNLDHYSFYLFTLLWIFKQYFIKPFSFSNYIYNYIYYILLYLLYLYIQVNQFFQFLIFM